MDNESKINYFRRPDIIFQEMKWFRRLHRNCFLTSTTFLIIFIIFFTFIGPFIARYVQMEYAFRNFNYSEIICEVAGNVRTDPTECCKARVKRELYNYRKYRLPLLIHSDVQNVPLNFDARQKWPFCSSINTVRDQGSCGSCWAVAVASTITDRLCIHSKEKIKTHISEQDLLTCCDACGGGCDGGDPAEAWKYWEKYGIVSGGAYGSVEGCKPYTFPPCVHSNLRNCSVLSDTPACHLHCQSDFRKSYWADLSYGHLVYSVVSDERQMMTEIIRNGPVQTRMTLYDDFMFYKSGIYYPRTGSRKISEHSVKIVGWGTNFSSGTDFWIVANSFNANWGENGFFRIKRGNTCNIETNVFGGIPMLEERRVQ